MTDQITWADVDAAHRRLTYETAICSCCRRVLIRRLPEGTTHRHLADARAGRAPLIACPWCARSLANRPN